MSESTPRQIERRTVFVLAGLILASVVSISFHQLDRHPAFFYPSEEFVDELDEHAPDVIFAHDPVALAALEKNQSDLDVSLIPLTRWPPEASLFVFGSTPRNFERAGLETVTAESVWSLWRPPDDETTPLFATASVETQRPGRTPDSCSPATGGMLQCGDQSWTRMGPRHLTIDGDESRCIWAHPLDGTTLRFRFPNVETVTDDGEHLYLETGLRDSAVGTDVPVDFDVETGDRHRSHRHQDRRGWQSIQIPPVESPDELTIEVTAENSGRRHVCFRFNLR